MRGDFDLLRERGLCLLDNLGEDFGLGCREIGEDFAVEFDVGFLEAVDKLTVGDAVELGACADLDLPIAAEYTFLLATVLELKCPCVQERFLGGSVLVLATPHEALGVLE